MKRTLMMLGFLCVLTIAQGGETATLVQTLGSAKPVELPGQAATIIKKAKVQELEKTTVRVVRAALAVNPAAAPVLIGTIARSVPQAAAVAAATAAEEQPKQAAAIARAAVAAAPSEVSKVVTAVCRSAPGQYHKIALATATALPDASREILLAVVAALPELKAAVEAALRQYSSGGIPMAAVLNEVARSLDPPTAYGPQPLGPRIGPPFIPLSGTVGTVTPETSQEVPTGGRDYARP